MTRPNYDNPNAKHSGQNPFQSGGRSPSRGNPTYNPGRSSDSGIDSIVTRIKSLKHLEELSVEDIAKEKGIADKLASDRKFRNELKTTQLRKFFDSIVNNQEKLKNSGWEAIESDFYMIRPNLAYAKGRKLIPEDFFKLVTACLEKVNPPGSTEEQIKKNYDRFVELMQALVAYIKYYGGQ